jgi:Spy/CpxP family protein refolding chaperone
LKLVEFIHQSRQIGRLFNFKERTMKKNLILMVMVMMLVAAAQSVWAQPSRMAATDGRRGAMAGGGMERAMPFPPHLLPMMTVALDLQQQQIEKISELQKNLRNTRQARHDLKAEQRKILAASTAGEFNSKTLRKDLEQLMARRVDLLVKSAELRQQLSTVLTAEQLSKCQALMESLTPPGACGVQRGMGPGRGMGRPGQGPMMSQDDQPEN